jgi:hypothetical protein
MGRREEAIEAMKESVELHRELAKERPAVFNGLLAKSLTILNALLLDAGRLEEVAATEEEVKDLRA